MRCSCGGTFLPERKRGSASEVVAVQRQRAANIGASSIAWIRSGRTLAECRYRPTSSSGKLWLVDSDSTIASSVAAACSSKLNLRQKRLRSARPHARLMRLPNGLWMTSCIPPDSSKKRSSTIVFCVGSVPSAARAAARYCDELLRRRCGELELARRIVERGRIVEPRLDVFAQPRHRRRKLVGAARRFAEPERNRRRLALRVVDANAPGFDPQDPIRRVAELEDVPGEALDREILVDGADELARGLEHDVVVGGVGYRAARCDGGEPGAAPAAQHAVDGVAMDVRRAMTAPRA